MGVTCPQVRTSKPEGGVQLHETHRSGKRTLLPNKAPHPAPLDPEPPLLGRTYNRRRGHPPFRPGDTSDEHFASRAWTSCAARPRKAGRARARRVSCDEAGVSRGVLVFTGWTSLVPQRSEWHECIARGSQATHERRSPMFAIDCSKDWNTTPCEGHSISHQKSLFPLHPVLQFMERWLINSRLKIRQLDQF